LLFPIFSEKKSGAPRFPDFSARRSGCAPTVDLGPNTQRLDAEGGDNRAGGPTPANNEAPEAGVAEHAGGVGEKALDGFSRLFPPQSGPEPP
jgi:hypothetical protein